MSVVPEAVGADGTVVPAGVRPLGTGELRHTISVAYRGDEAAPAVEASRALLCDVLGRARRR